VVVEGERKIWVDHNTSPPLAAAEPSLLDQIAAMMNAQLAPVTCSIRVLTDHLDDMEDQHDYDKRDPMDEPAPTPYSPSGPAPPWNPMREPEDPIPYTKAHTINSLQCTQHA
jgi:hypothetical protein